MQSEKGRAAARIGKSICVSALFTLAAVLLFALLIKIFSWGSSVIMPVNQAIKLVSIALGCIFCLAGEKPLLCGVLSGLGTSLVTYFLFSAVAGSISFGWGNVLDLIFGAVAGAIGGVLAVLLRGK